MAFGGAKPDAPTPATPYLWKNVVVVGGGFVSCIITHPTTKGLMYARTDVGGAYRWNDQAKRWIPITDQFGQEKGTCKPAFSAPTMRARHGYAPMTTRTAITTSIRSLATRVCMGTCT